MRMSVCVLCFTQFISNIHSGTKYVPAICLYGVSQISRTLIIKYIIYSFDMKHCGFGRQMHAWFLLTFLFDSNGNINNIYNSTSLQSNLSINFIILLEIILRMRWMRSRDKTKLTKSRINYKTESNDIAFVRIFFLFFGFKFI